MTRTGESEAHRPIGHLADTQATVELFMYRRHRQCQTLRLRLNAKSVERSSVI